MHHISLYNMNQGLDDLTYIDENEVRLNVTTGWQSLEILSEVGVAYTFRGFNPARIVSRNGARHVLLIGAKSLSEPLNQIRKSRGHLIGIEIRCRKTGSEKTAVYEIETIN